MSSRFVRLCYKNWPFVRSGPYVSGCPACTDNLFGVIANRTIEEIHQADREEGRLAGSIMSSRIGDERTAGEKAHFQAASAATAQLLREAGAQQHEHKPC